jgi:hypothetical protein
MERHVGHAQGAGEIFYRDWTKLEAGHSATGNVGFLNVNNGIRKAADPRYDRDRAVSQGAKLSQAAWFETRRHHNGIRTSLNEMGESLIIADQNRYPARIRFCNRLIAILEIRISTPKQSQLHSFVQDRGNVLKKEIESLLPGQSTYDAKQKRVRRWIKAKPPLQRRLVRRTEL